MQSGIPYHRVLNPAQLAAAAHGKGPLLVIAGAGSGKTRTLTYRVAKLVEEGVTPESILLLSFTRKASQEMLRRATHLLDQRCQRVAGGTFHSFANSVLRRYAGRIGFPKGFSIIDRADTEALIGMIRKELEAAEGLVDLPRKSTLANIFSRSINKSISIEEVIFEDYPQFGHAAAAIYTLWNMYRERKREHFFCDYDDLLTYFHQLLVENPQIRHRLADRYEFILVDEYQDTNAIQAEIIYLLSDQAKNVMVVGDDAQSIYAFRGANFKNILNFPDHFPGTRIIKLEENYRSRQPILDLTNAIIEAADERYTKNLFTRRKGGQPPMLVACSSENAQSRYIVDKLMALTGSGVALHEIAVLFRAGFHSFDLELELGRHGVPFVKYGGFKFTESAHIKDLLAHLRILGHTNDRLSWDRVLRLVNKIGPKSAQAIYASIIRTGMGAAGLLKIPVTKSQETVLEPLKELIAEITDAPTSLVQTGEYIMRYYLPILQRQYDDHPRRLRDLQQMLSIMDRYDNLQDFLADMALEPPTSSIEGHLAGSNQESRRLVLSTVHSAKGLEWNAVFLIWALDGRFPSHFSLERPEALEEERRLMYVAATRAKESLYITYPAQAFDRSTQSYLYKPSRFLEHIGEDLMERVYYQ
jgi:DNA helicase II / ATP-dependent DNA helicase PcrA